MRSRERAGQTQAQPRRFYDGGLRADAGAPEVPPDPSQDPRIVLERHLDDGLERFSLGRRLAYLDRHLGELIVPADAGFRTDLTSTPALFTWLVPKTGAHLPAALLHDGLVGGGEGEGPSYLSTDGHVVDRPEADRVFRDAMADTGTGVVRRWVVWSAVTVATIFVPGGLRGIGRWWHRVAAALTIALIMWLGWSATSDLADRSWPLAVDLPWMREGPFLTELLGGLAGAIAIPMLLGRTWGRFARAGMIGGVVLATLLHVTVGVLAVSLGYRAAEWVARRWPRAALALVACVVVAAVAGFAWLMVT